MIVSKSKIPEKLIGHTVLSAVCFVVHKARQRTNWRPFYFLKLLSLSWQHSISSIITVIHLLNYSSINSIN